MAAELFHTPEGVRDLYDKECARKLAVSERISQVFHLYGYQDIETPTFEFFDVFNKERGSVSSREMFKFFDRDNNTLVLKPDVTPAIARCVAKYFMEETLPVRLCYRERTFTNNTSYQGRLKEVTQTGVELIGDDSSTADGEMIAMVIDGLKASGLKEFQVEVGQMEFFRGLVEEAGMDEETEEILREQIENKNYFGVEELVSRRNLPDTLREVFLKLPELFGTLEEIKKVKSMIRNQRSLKAIERLEEVQAILEDYEMEEYVSYDLGMLSKYQYYTGIIFKAYTYGTGEYIVTGGRYDKLLVQFGKDVPAVGFAIVVDQLMLAMARQKIDIRVKMPDIMVVYEAGVQDKAVKTAHSLRKNGVKTVLVRKAEGISEEECREYWKRQGIGKLVWVLVGKVITWEE
ncbi:MAG: ATP phosphoribosyltransferase regulatory subunit [Hungatella sp.]|nr:ATP phosphoribosyltransferase regulatory subunit [Hungatella sp.]